MQLTAQNIQLAATLISGGAMGALLTAIVTKYRTRIQPVGTRMKTTPVFERQNGMDGFRARVSIDHKGAECVFENLFTIDLELINRGNQDMNEFDFGLTLSSGAEVIHVEPSSSDRHHTVVPTPDIVPWKPQAQVDFLFQPFNRGDLYAIRLYVVLPPGQDEVPTVQLSSRRPVRFVPLPTAGDLAQSVALGIGENLTGSVLLRRR